MSETRRLPIYQQEADALMGKLKKLGSPSELVETVTLPPDVAAALSTARPELLRLIQPRDMTADEVGHLYRLIGVLIETNATLIAHARGLEAMAASLRSNLKGVNNLALALEQVAGFHEVRVAKDQD